MLKPHFGTLVELTSMGTCQLTIHVSIHISIDFVMVCDDANKKYLLSLADVGHSVPFRDFRYVSPHPAPLCERVACSGNQCKVSNPKMPLEKENALRDRLLWLGKRTLYLFKSRINGKRLPGSPSHPVGRNFSSRRKTTSFPSSNAYSPSVLCKSMLTTSYTPKQALEPRHR